MDAWGVSRDDATEQELVLWDRTVDALLAHRAVAAQLVAELRGVRPQLAAALEAIAALFKGRRDLRPLVDERLREARAGSSTPAIVDALSAWNQDSSEMAATRIAAVRRSHPADPLLAKLQHGLLFLMGRSEPMLRALEETRDQWGERRAFLRGCLAFALVENHRLEEAEREGRAAVDAQPDDAWGIHAVAHVMAMQDRVGECIAWLDRNAAGYADCGVFKRHVYWHWALMHLAQRELDAALHLYDTRVRTDWQGDYRDMSNQSTLLWRLERAGVDVGDRWEVLVDVARRRCRDHGSAFADPHYALTLTRAGEAEPMLDSLRTFVAEHDGDQARVQREVGLPLCRLVAAGPNADADAFDALAPHIIRIGGSHAQREIFELMRADARLS